MFIVKMETEKGSHHMSYENVPF